MTKLLEQHAFVFLVVLFLVMASVASLLWWLSDVSYSEAGVALLVSWGGLLAWIYEKRNEIKPEWIFIPAVIFLLGIILGLLMNRAPLQ